MSVLFLEPLLHHARFPEERGREHSRFRALRQETMRLVGVLFVSMMVRLCDSMEKARVRVVIDDRKTSGGRHRRRPHEGGGLFVDAGRGGRVRFPCIPEWCM